MHKFQVRLEEMEREKYVTYRFNKTIIKRITQLDGDQLDSFMVKFRPAYEFVSTTDQLTFNQFVLDASYQFKIDLLKRLNSATCATAFGEKICWKFKLWELSLKRSRMFW